MRLRRLLIWPGPVLVVCLIAGALAGCGGGAGRSSTTGHVAAQRHTVVSSDCERNPLDGVHGPDRLKVLGPCVTFQGTVVQAAEQNPSDGDTSFDVSPGPGYASMLNATNRREGGLHVELVPRDQPGCTPGQPVVYGDVEGLGICSGRDLVAPAAGAHLRIVGAWVLDRNNRWYEIHPAWSITTPPPGSAGCRVPRLIGRTPRQARAVVARAGCSVGRISHRSSRSRLKGRVIAQRPRQGAQVGERYRVNLIVGLGRHSR